MSAKHRSTPPHRPVVEDDSGEAFVADTTRDRARLPRDAEEFAEEFIATATSAEDAFAEARDELIVEELGGPYLEIDGKEQPSWFSSGSTEDEEEEEEED